MMDSPKIDRRNDVNQSKIIRIKPKIPAPYERPAILYKKIEKDKFVPLTTENCKDIYKKKND